MLFLIAIFVVGVAGSILARTVWRRNRSAAMRRRGDGRADAMGRYCPGGQRGIWRWLDLAWPWNWFIKSGCGYDLMGHRTALPSMTTVRCPECGNESPVRRLMAGRRQVRWVNVGGVMLTAAAVMGYLDRPGARQTAAALPTEALLWAEIALTHRNHEQFRNELMTRARNRGLSSRQERWLIPVLIRDLRADDRGRNASAATSVLSLIWPQSEGALREALHSDDEQQRHLAAAMIRRHAMQPDERLVEVTIEGLRSDCTVDHAVRVSFGRSGTRYGGFDFLRTWYNQAHHHIVAALDSDDEQQRLICAGLVALAGDAGHMEASAAILVHHLRDNNEYRDAIFAAQALFAFGPDVVPLIEHAVNGDDHQQRGLAEHIIYELLPDLALESPAPIPPRLSTYPRDGKVDLTRVVLPSLY